MKVEAGNSTDHDMNTKHTIRQRQVHRHEPASVRHMYAHTRD